MQVLKYRGLAAALVFAACLVAARTGESSPDGKRKAARAGAEKKAKTSPNPPTAGSTADCKADASRGGLAGVSEASGIAVGLRTPGILWTHADSYSAEPVLFAFDSRGEVRGKVRVEGVSATDWEDIAVAPCGRSSCLYVADIGDNQATRKSVSIYRVPEPLPTDASVKPIETLHAVFPDRPQDAEAMFVTTSGEIFVVTKGDRSPAAVYRVPSAGKAGETATLQKVATIHASGVAKDLWITGGGSSPDGRWIALRTHGSVYFYETDRLLRGDVSGSLRYDAAGLKEAQGEGVALGANGALFLAGEGGGKGIPGTLASGTCRLPAR